MMKPICTACTHTVCSAIVHFHANLGVSANMNADNSKTSQMIGLASRFILAIPFIGAQLRLWGVQSVNAKNIIRLMENRKQILVLPGGF